MGWISLLDIVYPVGSIYISVVDKSPAEIVGGTWTGLFNSTQLRNYVPGGTVEGQAPLGDYGGSNFISVEQLPAHKHTARGTVNGYIQKYDADSTRFYGESSGYFRYSGVENAPVTVTVSAVGGARGSWESTPLSVCGNVLPNLRGRRW